MSEQEGQVPTPETTPIPNLENAPRPPNPQPVSDGFRFLRDFFRTSGGSVLFCLSAVSIFYGLSSVVGPILGTSYALNRTLPAIGTIALYEASLFAVLFALVVRWHIMRDAVSLLMLVAIFLVTLGVLVSTVANDNPTTVAIVGSAAALLALAEMAVVRQRIGVPISRLAFTGFGILLVWNCLNSTALAYYIDQDDVRIARDLWPLCAAVPLAGLFFLYLSAALVKRRA